MHNIATVHVLATAGSAAVALCRALKPKVVARHWAAAPPVHEVRPGDVVVVDLTDAHHPVDPSRLQPLLGRGTVCLIPGDAPISPHWLDLASQPGVHVLSASSRQTGDATVAELLRLVQGPTGRRVAELVLNAEPTLRFVEPLVEVLCGEPWSIRRPRDLALRSGMTLDAVRRQCGELGFTRVEHFIICVRLLAYSELVAREHLPIRTARALAGFGDPSNMRRHAQRAASRSPIVVRALLQADRRDQQVPGVA
jgi:hypothetical protein